MLFADPTCADTAPRPLTLSVDWFSQHVPVFNAALQPLADASAASGVPLRLVEVGSFEGLSAAWVASHVLCRAAPRSTLDCVDTFGGGAEHARWWGDGNDTVLSALEARFDANVAPHLASGAVRKRKGLSREVLGALLAEGAVADFVYIDGSHAAPDVLTDAVMAFWLTRPGGIIAFDDYTWSDDGRGKVDPTGVPKLAVDAFLDVFAHRVKVLGRSYQLWLQRTS